MKPNTSAYRTVHYWVVVRLGKPQECENCGRTDASRYEWANLSGDYLRDTSDWARLCVRCHRLIDGVLVNLKLAYTPEVLARRSATRRERNEAKSRLI